MRRMFLAELACALAVTSYIDHLPLLCLDILYKEVWAGPLVI